MKNLTVALLVVLGVLAGFLGGWGYSNAHASSSGSASANASRSSGGAARTFAGGGFAGGAGGGFARTFANGGGVVGQITAINGNTITVHSRLTGTDVKVTLSSGTTITHQVTGNASDLAANQTITVVGTSASDGSISAKTIAIQPTPLGAGTTAPTP